MSENQVKPEPLGGRATGVEVLREGEFIDHAGRKLKIGAADLAALAANFAANPDVPLVLGHDEKGILSLSAATPAAGWAEKLYVKGGRLLADVRDIPAAVAGWLNGKIYRKVSLALARTKDGLVARHIGLLGAHPPAVSGLADFPRVEFSAADESSSVVSIESGGGEDAASEALKKIESVAAQIEELGRALSERLKLERRRRVLLLVEKLVGEGRITPAEAGGFEAHALSLADDESIIELAGEGAKKESRFDEFCRLAEARPRMKAFCELAADPSRGEEDPERAAAERRFRDFYEEHEDALKGVYSEDEFVESQLLAEGFKGEKNTLAKGD